MMTLKEAIEHCKDVALSCSNKKCALEHFQLAKWLQEYNNILERQGEQQPIFSDGRQRDAWEYIEKFKTLYGHYPKDADEIGVIVNEMVNKITKENMLLPFKEYDNLMESINKKKKEGYETGYKQGLIDSKNEQKSANKVEPKFNVGDWVVDKDGIVRQIFSYKNGVYKHTDGYSAKIYEDEWRLWDITKDAKDGDVLSYLTDEGYLWIMIYRSLYEHYEGHVHYYALLVKDNFYDKGACCICIDNLKPTTKEQRDLLFQKMHEVGYEWNAEKKKLKKIIDEKQIKKNLQDNSFRRMFEQKPIPKHKIGDTIYYNSFGEVKSMIVAKVVTDSTDNPMYEDKEGNAVFEKDLIKQKPAE